MGERKKKLRERGARHGTDSSRPGKPGEATGAEGTAHSLMERGEGPRSLVKEGEERRLSR